MARAILAGAMMAAVLAGASAGAAPAVSKARMRGFAALAEQGERVDITGIGWGEKGRFALSTGGTGRFERRASSGLWSDRVQRDGSSRFTLADGDPAGDLTGACRFDEEAVRQEDGALRVDTVIRPFSYRCEFRRGSTTIGTMEIEAVFSRKLSVTNERCGWADIRGQRLELRSAHDFEQGRAPASDALGYIFAANGHDVGAIDLNGGTKRMVLPRAPAQREAALATSLALAFFWDPGQDD